MGAAAEHDVIVGNMEDASCEAWWELCAAVLAGPSWGDGDGWPPDVCTDWPSAVTAVDAEASDTPGLGGLRALRLDDIAGTDREGENDESDRGGLGPTNPRSCGDGSKLTADGGRSVKVAPSSATEYEGDASASSGPYCAGNALWAGR